jgi:hypothetical protein
MTNNQEKEGAGAARTNGGAASISDIRQRLASRIGAKNKRLPTYRANSPHGSPVWLLLYSRVTVSRSLPIPYGIDQWKFPFGFACLENAVVEIQRA